MRKVEGEPVMTVREAGKKGGESCFARHGKEYYAKIGKKGGLAKARAEWIRGLPIITGQIFDYPILHPLG